MMATRQRCEVLRYTAFAQGRPAWRAERSHRHCSRLLLAIAQGFSGFGPLATSACIILSSDHKRLCICLVSLRHTWPVDTLPPPTPSSFWQRLKQILAAPFEAAIAFLGHLFLGMVVLGGIWLSGLIFKWLYPAQEPMFFDVVPVKWMFDASKVALLIVFIVYGAIDAIK